MTPRGMAAPPVARPLRVVDADPTRPATIRIEANGRIDSPQREELVRQLDRARAATPGRRTASAFRLNGLLVTQGLLLNAFMILLVFGWSAPLPGRSLLLGCFAAGGIVLAGLIAHALQRAGVARRSAGRSGFGLAGQALPATLIAVWLALSLYALGVPQAAKAVEDADTASAATAAHVLPAQGTR